MNPEAMPASTSKRGSRRSGSRECAEVPIGAPCAVCSAYISDRYGHIGADLSIHHVACCPGAAAIELPPARRRA